VRTNVRAAPGAGPTVSATGEEVFNEARILVADEDPESCRRMQESLGALGCSVTCVSDGQAVLDTVAEGGFDLVVLDLHLANVSGLNVLAALPAMETDARFIVVTRDGDVESAVEAMKAGACDYLEKPVDADRLKQSVLRGLREQSVDRAVRQSRRAPAGRGTAALVGQTPIMRKLFRLVERVAPTNASVLVTGETGTGKDLVARAVHDASPRSEGPFIAVNCSAIPSTLLEAELFGHTRGSFTGAVQSRKGLVEEAHGGTLFLDEISTLSHDVQVKLLRVLQDHRVQRVGSSAVVSVDFRLVAATNSDLADLVARGDFRQDLFFRLDVFPIRVPPLRERRDDILPLADHFLTRFSKGHGVAPPRISAPTLARMMTYDWPGNVRELENFIERSVIMYPGAASFPFDLPRVAPRGDEKFVELATERRWTLERLEREYLLSTLESNRWHQSAAAEILGINRRTIHRKLKRYREEGFLPGVDID